MIVKCQVELRYGLLWLGYLLSLYLTRQVTRAPRLSLSRNTIMNFQTGKRYKTIRHC